MFSRWSQVSVFNTPTEHLQHCGQQPRSRAVIGQRGGRGRVQNVMRHSYWLKSVSVVTAVSGYAGECWLALSEDYNTLYYKQSEEPSVSDDSSCLCWCLLRSEWVFKCALESHATVEARCAEGKAIISLSIECLLMLELSLSCSDGWVSFAQCLQWKAEKLTNAASGMWQIVWGH